MCTKKYLDMLFSQAKYHSQAYGIFPGNLIEAIWKSILSSPSPSEQSIITRLLFYKCCPITVRTVKRMTRSNTHV